MDQQLFKHRYRYFILLLSWICLTSISSNMMALNFTLICMSPPVREGINNNNGTATVARLRRQTSSTASTVDDGNLNDGISTTSEFLPPTTTTLAETHPEHGGWQGPKSIANDGKKLKAPVFVYTSQQKAWLQWSVGIGSLVGTFPFSWLCTRYGARFVLLGAGLISAVSTALIPLAAVRHFYLFLLMRFWQGISYSADFAVIGMICSRWAGLKQYATFISVLTCFTPLSTTVTNAVSGVICERFGWPMVYYSHSAVCVLLFVFWAWLYNDFPSTVPCVTEIELEKINRNKTKEHIEMDKYVPYKAILTDKLILVVWLNAWCDIFTFVFLSMYIPSYFSFVLNYGVKETGLLGSLPTLLTIVTRIIFGYGSDTFRCICERSKMILFNTVAVAIPGFFFFAIGFVPTNVDPLVVVLLFIGMHIFFSVSGGGFYKCAALYSRQYYHFVIANIQFSKCISLFLGPILMTIFVKDETNQAQWRTIFILFSALLLISNALFCCVATDQPAKWLRGQEVVVKTTHAAVENVEMKRPLPADV